MLNFLMTLLLIIIIIFHIYIIFYEEHNFKFLAALCGIGAVLSVCTIKFSFALIFLLGFVVDSLIYLFHEKN